MKNAIWYEINREEAVVPVWRAALKPTKQGKRTVQRKGGGQLELSESMTLEAALIGRWEVRKITGFMVRIKARLGKLTFEYKLAGPFRRPADAKKAARQLIKEATQWHAETTAQR